MFTSASRTIRESTYALIARSARRTISCGTAFMIAPGVLATVAHVLYKEAGDSSSFQDSIRVMRDPEINTGHKMEEAKVIAVDVEYDIGLLRIASPRSQASVVFTTATVLVGTEIAAIGYPLMNPHQITAQVAVPLLRFQGGHISAIYGKRSSVSARQLAYYETDMPMYKGSSGCPGFLRNGVVFAIHVAEWHDGGSKENPGQRAFSMWAPASAIISLSRENKIDIPSST